MNNSRQIINNIYDLLNKDIKWMCKQWIDPMLNEAYEVQKNNLIINKRKYIQISINWLSSNFIGYNSNEYDKDIIDFILKYKNEIISYYKDEGWHDVIFSSNGCDYVLKFYVK